jgi:hypothetical protein
MRNPDDRAGTLCQDAVQAGIYLGEEDIIRIEGDYRLA